MNEKSQRMGQDKISKLLFTMSIPAIISMLVQALYNIVDSIFVANYSADGLSALTFAFPLQMLQFSFALGIGIGASSLIARKLGQKSVKEANNAAKTGLALAILVAIFFMIMGIILPSFFMNLFTNNNNIIQLGVTYLAIVMVGNIPMFIDLTSTKILQGTGNMKIPMISQLIGAITNIILDPIFIFQFDLGVAGAAYATIIGQLASCIFSFSILLLKKHDIKVDYKSPSIDKKSLIDITKVGLPATILNAISSFTTIIMYSILVPYDEAAAVVLGIYFKIQSFVFMPVFGLTQGAMPIMGFNYGANKKERFYKTFYLSLSVAVIIMVLGFIIFQVFPKELICLFNNSNNYIKIGKPALRIISLCFIPAALGIVTSTMYQSIGHGNKSLMMSLLRQVIILLPTAYFFGKWFGLDALWLCYCIAELITVIIFVPIGFRTLKKIFKKSSSNEMSSSINSSIVA